MIKRPLSVTRWERKLRALAGALGSDLIKDVGELTGLVTLESDRPEWAAAAGDRLCSARIIAPLPTAGQFQFGQLLNPLSSGVLAVVERIMLGTTSAAGGQIAIGIGDTAFSAPVAQPGSLRDSRMFVGQPVATNVGFACRTQTQSLAAAPGLSTFIATMFFSTTAAASQYLDPIIIHPGFTLLFLPGIIDQSWNCYVVWRELALEGGVLG